MCKEYQINKIEDMASLFYEIRRLFVTDATALWFDNLFINSILVRAHQINKGFLALTETDNYLCAAPLVRIQLETLLRLYEPLIVGGKFMSAYMEGRNLEQFKFKGRNVTYGYLCELYEKQFNVDNLQTIYRRSNKLLHPSDLAFKAATWSVDRTVTIHNLESKLFEDDEMEQLKSDMFDINTYYIPVLDIYYKQFIDTINEMKTVEQVPVTDKATIKKVSDTIDNLLNLTHRNINSKTNNNEKKD